MQNTSFTIKILLNFECALNYKLCSDIGENRVRLYTLITEVTYNKTF